MQLAFDARQRLGVEARLHQRQPRHLECGVAVFGERGDAHADAVTAGAEIEPHVEVLQALA